MSYDKDFVGTSNKSILSSQENRVVIIADHGHRNVVTRTVKTHEERWIRTYQYM